MEQGSTSLSTSACTGNPTFRLKHEAVLIHIGAEKGCTKRLPVDLDTSDRPSLFHKLWDSLPIVKDFPRLIFEAIEQSEDGVVVLSEEFFTSEQSFVELVAQSLLELVAMANAQKREPSLKIIPVHLAISFGKILDQNLWKAMWHIHVEGDRRIVLKDWANALQLIGSTNGVKYSFELGEVKFRRGIVDAICRLVPPQTQCEDSHIQGRSRSCKVIHEKISGLEYNIPRGAIYKRPNSNKFEPRIKFPVTRGAGGKSKRIPLGSYDSVAEAEVAYQIATFYCKKPKHTGRLDLGGGAYFPIPAWSVDPNLPYEAKVKQVGDQVLKVYAEFKERQASINLPPSVPGLPSVMPTREGQLSVSSVIQQLKEPLNSEMDLAMECQGFELGLNTHNRVDFNNPGSLLRLHTESQHELLRAYKQQEYWKAQVSRLEVQNKGLKAKNLELDRKYSELERKCSELEQRYFQLEPEYVLWNHQSMQSTKPASRAEIDPD